MPNSADQLPATFAVHRFDRVGSTNDVAKQMAGEGAADRTVIVAAVQDQGRGRYGRSWESGVGNLYCTTIFRPAKPVSEAAQIGYVAAVAVAETVRSLASPQTQVACKWPNDVLADGRKIAGILAESSVRADGNLDWIVLGIGINVAHHPAESRWPGTNLNALSVGEVSPEEVLPSLLQRLDDWMMRWSDPGFEPIRSAWLNLAWLLGEDMQVNLSDRTVQGRFESLDATGALILTRVDGATEKIHYGDVFPVEAA